MQEKHSVLVADDCPETLETVSDILEESGFEVVRAECGERAIELIESERFDIILTDLAMGEVGGIEVLEKAKSVNPDVGVILLTGNGDLKSAIKALRLQADDYILKPFNASDLILRIRTCLDAIDRRRRKRLTDGFLPVCCMCNSARDDSTTEPGEGEWMPMEKYVMYKSNVKITSTYCPECYEKIVKKIEED